MPGRGASTRPLPSGRDDSPDSRQRYRYFVEFRRDFVQVSQAKKVISSAMAIEKEFTHLSADGPPSDGDGWIAQHLNAQGASDDASKFTAANGRKPPMTGRRLHRFVA